MQHTVLGWPRVVKGLVVIALDVVMSLLTPEWHSVCAFRQSIGRRAMVVYALAPVLVAPVFIWICLYRTTLRHTWQATLVMTAKAVVVYGALLLRLLLWRGWPRVPRSLGVL